MTSKYLLFSLHINDGHVDEVLEYCSHCEDLELVTWLFGLEYGKVFIVQNGKVVRVGKEK